MKIYKWIEMKYNRFNRDVIQFDRFISERRAQRLIYTSKTKLFSAISKDNDLMSVYCGMQMKSLSG